MRTPMEILVRIGERRQIDQFGFEWTMYVEFLNYKSAKQFLKGEVKESDWDKRDRTPTEENIKKTMLNYMEFAWGKANDKRGVSADRSICHYIAWLWLYGDDEFAQKFEKEYEKHYKHYGKELLIMVCEKFGWDYKKWDDGVRTNG